MSDLEIINNTMSLLEVIEKFGGYSSSKTLKRALTNKGVILIPWGKSCRVNISDLALLFINPNKTLARHKSKTNKPYKPANDMEAYYLKKLN